MNVGHSNNLPIENRQIDKQIPDRNGLETIAFMVTFVAISVLALSVIGIYSGATHTNFIDIFSHSIAPVLAAGLGLGTFAAVACLNSR